MTTTQLALFEPSPDESVSWQDRPLRLELLGPLARGEAMALWREVEARLSNQRLMCSSIWTETWLSHFGTLVPHRFAIARRGDECCGVALLTNGVQQYDGPMPIKTWHLGTAGEPDADSVCIEYNSLLVGDEDRDDFAGQLMAWKTLRRCWSTFLMPSSRESPRTTSIFKRRVMRALSRLKDWGDVLVPACVVRSDNSASPWVNGPPPLSVPRRSCSNSSNFIRRVGHHSVNRGFMRAEGFASSISIWFDDSCRLERWGCTESRHQTVSSVPRRSFSMTSE
jgi:hypothetical protein